MAKKTPEQIIEKYQRNVSAAGQDYTAGVLSPSRDWAQSTAAAEPRWKASLQEAMAKGKFGRGVAKAGTPKWQEAASTVGAERYIAAAPRAAQQFAAQAGKIIQAGNAAREAAGRLPNTTKEQRIQRAVAAMNAVSAFWEGQS